MKKIFSICFIFIIFISVLKSEIRNIGENYQVVYNILDTDGIYISTETVTVKIKKVSNNYWYDFSDDSFKISGWTSLTTNLSEDTTNQFYYYTFNPPASEISSEQYIFVLDNANVTYKDHYILSVNYQDIGTSTTTPKEIWNHGTKEITGGTIDSLTTNLDKTGYSGVLTENVTCYSNLDKIGYSATLTENVTAYTLINNQDKTGYSGTLTEQVTAYTLIDKNNFRCIEATPTLKGIDDIVNNVWDELQSGHISAGTFGKYLDSPISSSSGTWTNAEKERVKSALTIEGSTPTWRLDMIDRDIRIFR